MAGLFNMLAGAFQVPTQFKQQYRCYSFAMLEKQFDESSDKIIMPPSALQTLSHMQVQYPMLFKLSNDAMQLSTHVGTLEFSAQEGHIHVPRWLMTSLALQEGSVVTLTNVSLPRASWVKLQPQHKSFLDLSNPKAILEKTLQGYSCMTKGKAFSFSYLNREYTVLVEDIKPADACCIIEADVNVDFSAPPGYEEEQAAARATAAAAAAELASDAAAAEGSAATPKDSPAFKGQGYTLNSAKRTTVSSGGAMTSSPALTSSLGGTILGGGGTKRTPKQSPPSTAAQGGDTADGEAPAFKLGGVRNAGSRLGSGQKPAKVFSGTAGGNRLDGKPSTAAGGTALGTMAAGAKTESATKKPKFDFGEPTADSATAAQGGSAAAAAAAPGTPATPGRVLSSGTPAPDSSGGTPLGGASGGGGFALGGPAAGAAAAPAPPAPGSDGPTNKFAQRFRPGAAALARQAALARHAARSNASSPARAPAPGSSGTAPPAAPGTAAPPGVPFSGQGRSLAE